MARRFYLLRHCSARGQDPDADLTEDGRNEADVVAQSLKRLDIDFVISSPYARALRSVEPFLNHSNIPSRCDERLSERILINTPTADWRELLRRTFEEQDLCFVGGESSRTAQRRILEAVRDGLERSSRPLFVTHGNLLALLLCAWDSSVGFDTWEQLASPELIEVTTSHDMVAPRWRKLSFR